jgi:hypothetical protein
VYVNSHVTYGNTEWNDKGESVVMEVNMSVTPRTLRFFHFEGQQGIMIINLPESIQFAVSSLLLSILSLFLFHFVLVFLACRAFDG